MVGANLQLRMAKVIIDAAKLHGNLHIYTCMDIHVYGIPHPVQPTHWTFAMKST